MSRSLAVYAIPTVVLDALAQTARGVQPKLAQHVPRADILLRPDDGPELVAAVEELVATIDRSSVSWISSGMWIAHAVERLGEVYGHYLEGISVEAVKLRKLEKMDAALQAQELGVSLQTLMYEGLPLPNFPIAADFPSLGHWSGALIEEAKRRYDEREPEHEDGDIDQLFLDVGEWLERATKNKADLVGIYY